MTRPRAGCRDAGARLGEPLGLAGGLPLVAPVLLAVAVRVSPSQREAAAQRWSAVRPCDVQTAQPSRVVAEPPRIGRRVGVGSPPGTHSATPPDPTSTR